MSPNTKRLRAIRSAGGKRADELIRLVPPTTLRRHLAGKMPTGEWMARYDLALGLRASEWIPNKLFRKEAKRTHALAYADTPRAPALTPEQRDAEAIDELAKLGAQNITDPQKPTKPAIPLCGCKRTPDRHIQTVKGDGWLDCDGVVRLYR